MWVYGEEIGVLLVEEGMGLAMEVVLVDFDVFGECVSTYLCTVSHLYLAYNEN